MATKLYLRTASSTVHPGGGKKSDVLPVGTLINVGGDLQLSLIKGSTNANVPLSGGGGAILHTDGYLKRFSSALLPAQTFGAGTWTYAFAASQGGRNDFLFGSCSLYVFVPSGGVVRGYIYDSDAPLGAAWATHAEGRVVTFTGVDVTAQAGDILVFEAWSHGAQPSALSYSATWFYGGNTEPVDGTIMGSTASYISTATTINFVVDAFTQGAWGDLTSTVIGQQNVDATAAGDWGALTGAVVHIVPATTAGSWGAMTGSVTISTGPLPSVTAWTDVYVEFMVKIDDLPSFVLEQVLVERNHLGAYFDGSTIRGGWLIDETGSISDYRWEAAPDASRSLYAEQYERTNGIVDALLLDAFPINEALKYTIITYDGVAGID